MVTTCEEPWVLSVIAHHENPYDVATLKKCLNKAEINAKNKIEYAFADKGYKGEEHHPKDIKIFISGKKNLSLRFRKLLKGRSGIEPIIGHLKQDHRLGCNYLLGRIVDKINTILSGCAFNLCKIMRLMSIEENCLA